MPHQPLRPNRDDTNQRVAHSQRHVQHPCTLRPSRWTLHLLLTRCSRERAPERANPRLRSERRTGYPGKFLEMLINAHAVVGRDSVGSVLRGGEDGKQPPLDSSQPWRPGRRKKDAISSHQTPFPHL